MLAQGGKRQGAQSPQAPHCRCCSDSARSSASNALLSAASSTSVPRLDSAVGTHRVLRPPEPPLLPPTTAMGCTQPTWCLCPDIAMVSVRLGMACHRLTLHRVTATSVTSLLGLAHAQLDVCLGLCVCLLYMETGCEPRQVCPHVYLCAQF